MDDDGTISGGIDIISNLPRDILCHILSFLPTKYAVGTCILSTKWKNLYSSIPNLIVELDETLLLHPESLSGTRQISFRYLVNKLLNVTLRDVPSILSLRLICQNFNDGQQIGDCILAALRLNVKELILLIYQLKKSSFLFNSLYGCNIVSLHVYLNLADIAPECRFSLPNLTTLSVWYTNFNVVNVLVASCPLLDKLIVDDCVCPFEEKLRICSPSLKALILNIGRFSLDGEIELDTPKLGYLRCSGFLALNYSVPRLYSLWGACFDLDRAAIQYAYQYGEQAIDLVKACSNAARLRLSFAFILVLHFNDCPLPRLENLEVLKMDKMDFRGWELLSSFLDCAPNLKVLVAEDIDFACYESFKAALKEPFTIHLYARKEVGFFFEIRRRCCNNVDFCRSLVKTLNDIWMKDGDCWYLRPILFGPLFHFFVLLEAHSYTPKTTFM